jgi:hypothetical protein
LRLPKRSAENADALPAQSRERTPNPDSAANGQTGDSATPRLPAQGFVTASARKYVEIYAPDAHLSPEFTRKSVTFAAIAISKAQKNSKYCRNSLAGELSRLGASAVTQADRLHLYPAFYAIRRR